MGVVVSKGFLVLAQNSQGIDYVKQAYGLALSIAMSQKDITNISIITNDTIPKKYQSVFDHIIPIPFNDDAVESKWKVENRWKLFHATPYDETVVLDTDMLMLEDITSWWDYCSQHDIAFCSRIKNYKQEVIIDHVHRKAFQSNNLPNTYFALHYFKKTDPAYEFYKILEFVCNNWEWSYTQLASVDWQNWLSMDLASAVALELYGGSQHIVDQLSPLEFIHMKTPIQSWPTVPATWQDAVPFILNSKGDLIVGNIKQTKLFHYVEKDFLTKDILNRLEELANGKKKK